MVVFVVIIFPKGLEKIRERFTHPRIGYVKVKPDVEFKVVTLLIFMISVFSMAGIAILLLSGGYGDTDNLYRIWPFILGMVMFGPAMHLQEKTGKDRYLLMGVFPTITGLLITTLSVIDDPWVRFEGIRLFTILWGIIFLLIGIVKFTWFMRTHPIMEDEESD